MIRTPSLSPGQWWHTVDEQKSTHVDINSLWGWRIWTFQPYQLVLFFPAHRVIHVALETPSCPLVNGISKIGCFWHPQNEKLQTKTVALFNLQFFGKGSTDSMWRMETYQPEVFCNSWVGCCYFIQVISAPFGYLDYMSTITCALLAGFFSFSGVPHGWCVESPNIYTIPLCHQRKRIWCMLKCDWEKIMRLIRTWACLIAKKYLGQQKWIYHSHVHFQYNKWRVQIQQGIVNIQVFARFFQPDRQKNLPRDRIWEGHNDTSSGLATTTTGTSLQETRSYLGWEFYNTMGSSLKPYSGLSIGETSNTETYTVYFTLQHAYTVCINRSTKVRRCVGLQVEDVCYVEQTSILKNNSIALPYLERDCCTKYWEYDTQTLQQVSNSCSISEMSKVVTSHIDINRLPNGKGVDQNLVVFHQPLSRQTPEHHQQYLKTC